MIASLLALLAASALDLGTSPLAEPGHAHRWVEIQNDHEGIGWIDEAWRGETEQEGKRLKLVLIRVDIRSPETMKADLVMAADCERNLLGIKDGYLFEAEFASQMRIPIQGLTMDFADTPPSEGDMQVIDFACGRTPTTK